MSDKVAPQDDLTIRCPVVGIQHPNNHESLPNAFAAQGLASSDIVKVIGTLSNGAGIVATALEPVAANNGLWIVTCKEVAAAASGELVLTVRGFKDVAGAQLGSTETRSFRLLSKKNDDAPERLLALNINYPQSGQRVATTFAAYGTYNARGTDRVDPLGICTVNTTVTPDFFHVIPGTDGFWIAAFKGLTANQSYKLTVSFAGATQEVQFNT